MPESDLPEALPIVFIQVPMPAIAKVCGRSRGPTGALINTIDNSVKLGGEAKRLVQAPSTLRNKLSDSPRADAQAEGFRDRGPDTVDEPRCLSAIFCRFAAHDRSAN